MKIIAFQSGRPFSGCSAVVDYCTHAHRDVYNAPGGTTAVSEKYFIENEELKRE